MPKTTQSGKDKTVLAVTTRDIFGKKLKSLRKQGKIPANIFGTGFKSASITVDLKEFLQVFRTTGETGVVYLTGLKEELPTLVKQVQQHPVTDVVLHVDFRKIDLTKKVETEVPVVFVNESEAVAQKGGVLLQQLKELTVEALPQDIPHEISVDISVIKEIGQEIKVSDLAASSSYQIKEEPASVVVSVVEHKEESVTPETTAAAAPEVITAAPEEGAEAAGEGAKPSAEQPAKAEPAPAKEGADKK